MTPVLKNAPNKIRGLYAIIDTSLIAMSEAEKTAVEILEGGARIIQLRAKDAPTGHMLEAARKIRALTVSYGALFMVNDRVDVALLSRANGVHLGNDDIPAEDARKLLGKNALIGISTHTRHEALEARKRGADYISFGPVFATKTKKDALSPRGLNALKQAIEAVSIPVVAIGGINEKNLSDVLACGVDATAIISDILTSKDIGAKVTRIRAGF
ncbi:MAG: thiamine phosphate synthase [Deltaproteobacteria bacterium]|nr:thiamine phosphate synthase [Deltaproteobacteria bacterium]